MKKQLINQRAGDDLIYIKIMIMSFQITGKIYNKILTELSLGDTIAALNFDSFFPSLYFLNFQTNRLLA